MPKIFPPSWFNNSVPAQSAWPVVTPFDHTQPAWRPIRRLVAFGPCTPDGMYPFAELVTDEMRFYTIAQVHIPNVKSEEITKTWQECDLAKLLSDEAKVHLFSEAIK